MKRFLLYVVAGWLAVVLQVGGVGAIIGGPYKPDLPFLLLLFFSLSQPLWRGLFLAVFLGYSVGVFSGSPLTLPLAVYIGAFALSRPVAWLFSPTGVPLQALYPFVFTLVKACLVLLAGEVLSTGVGPAAAVLSAACVEAILNAGVALALFPALERLDRGPAALRGQEGGRTGWA